MKMFIMQIWQFSTEQCVFTQSMKSVGNFPWNLMNIILIPPDRSKFISFFLCFTLQTLLGAISCCLRVNLISQRELGVFCRVEHCLNLHEITTRDCQWPEEENLPMRMSEFRLHWKLKLASNFPGIFLSFLKRTTNFSERKSFENFQCKLFLLSSRQESVECKKWNRNIQIRTKNWETQTLETHENLKFYFENFMRNRRGNKVLPVKCWRAMKRDGNFCHSEKLWNVL